MKKILRLFVPTLVLGMAINAAPAQTTATPAGGFVGTWYEITGGRGSYPNKYGGGTSTYPQQIAPIAIYRPEVNKTFFTFNLDAGDGRVSHAISYFDHNTGLLARPQIWLNTGTNDAHDASVITIDDQGYLYQFSMTHGENRRAFIRKSANPYDISSFVGLLSSSDPADMAVFGNPPATPGMTSEPRFSYAGAWYRPNAPTDHKFLLLHSRYVNEDRDLFTTTSADGDTWTVRRTLAQIERGQYQTSWIKPDGNTVGTIFNVHPNIGTPSDNRTDLYYLQTSDGALTWQTVDGTTLVNHTNGNSPLTSRPGGTARVYDAADGERVYLKDVNYDRHGNPVILFLTSPTNAPGDVGNDGQPDRFLRVAHWANNTWNINTVTSTDHNYDHGSLYVESDESGQETWRLIGPWLDGPQKFGTGGEIGVWISQDQGESWQFTAQLTSGSAYNHSYVRRPLDAHPDFYGLWSDGHAWENSDVHLYFTTQDGRVYRMPDTFEPGADFAAPILVPEPAAAASMGAMALLLLRRRLPTP